VDLGGIWTLPASCAQQDRSAFEFLVGIITAHFQNQPQPSLPTENL